MRSHRGRLSMAVVALAATLSLPGCVERRYTIRTDPPGALVIANGEPIGTTPVSKSFTFYGDRTFRIIKEGYETKDLVEKFRAPWYDNFLTEFFTENLNPYTFRDEREFTFNLKPVAIPSDAELVQRANALSQQGTVPPKPQRCGILGFFGF